MKITPFAERFRDLAGGSEKNYKQLASEMELSPPLLARVLNGSRPPTTNFVRKCVEVFGLTTREAEELQYLADISQQKINIVPRDVEEAKKIVAFVRELQT